MSACIVQCHTATTIFPPCILFFLNISLFLLVCMRSSRAKNATVICTEDGDGDCVFLAALPSVLFLVKKKCSNIAFTSCYLFNRLIKYACYITSVY
jgi:hypothetical protein